MCNPSIQRKPTIFKYDELSPNALPSPIDCNSSFVTKFRNNNCLRQIRIRQVAQPYILPLDTIQINHLRCIYFIFHNIDTAKSQNPVTTFVKIGYNQKNIQAHAKLIYPLKKCGCHKRQKTLKGQSTLNLRICQPPSGRRFTHAKFIHSNGIWDDVQKIKRTSITSQRYDDNIHTFWILYKQTSIISVVHSRSGLYMYGA